MWIEVKKDIFQDADIKSIHFILRLLTWHPMGTIPRYHLLVRYDSVEPLESYKQLSLLDKDIIAKEFDDAVNNSITPKYAITNRQKANHFNIEEAIRFLMQPISIILENSKNDSLFLEAIMFHFDKKNEDGQQKLVEFYKNGWLQFENAGGCTNVLNFVEGKLQGFNALAAKNNRNNSDYLRCFVVLDSDKTFPTAPPKHTDLMRQLNGYGIHFHILKKRMMENYMPDAVFEKDILPNLKSKDAKLKTWINVYLKLSVEQKDYLNYFDGFEDNPPVEVQNLYKNVVSKDLSILKAGFKYLNFKTKFPLFFKESIRIHISWKF